MKIHLALSLQHSPRLLPICALLLALLALMLIGGEVEGYRDRSRVGLQHTEDERAAELSMSLKGPRLSIQNVDRAKGRKTSHEKHPQMIPGDPAILHPNDILYETEIRRRKRSFAEEDLTGDGYDRGLRRFRRFFDALEKKSGDGYQQKNY